MIANKILLFHLKCSTICKDWEIFGFFSIHFSFEKVLLGKLLKKKDFLNHFDTLCFKQSEFSFILFDKNKKKAKNEIHLYILPFQIICIKNYIMCLEKLLAALHAKS